VKAISIAQPYAHLIARGEKRIETRTWQTPYRGYLAIHASKSRQYDAQLPSLQKLGIGLGLSLDELPRGAVIAVAKLVAVVATARLAVEVSAADKAAGDYTAGRWGFVLEDVHALADPIAVRGLLNIWTLPLPVSLAVLDQLPIEAGARQVGLLV
jgi:hypothetical protein